MNRDEVYKIIDGEREYQISKWGETHDDQESIAGFVVTMQAYLNDAVANLGKGGYDLAALTSLRKVTAVGVACLEQFGVPPRNSGLKTFTIHSSK